MKCNAPLAVGTTVLHHGATCRIVAFLDSQSAVIEDPSTGERRTVTVTALQLVDRSRTSCIDGVSPKQWEGARQRRDCIAPLVGLQNRTRADVEARAKEIQKDPASLYRWLRRYEASPRLSSLVDACRNARHRLRPEQEEILSSVIQSFYLTHQRPNVSQAAQQVAKECSRHGLAPPHLNTVRRRISEVALRERTVRRHGTQTAAIFTPRKGSFPAADFPLAVVQIDHTKLDVVLVHESNRALVLGRPWLTLAIDVFSRMVTGYYVSMDPPGTVATGICLAHSILPKREYLTRYGIKSDWPCWGIPSSIHLDNAMEFRGATLERACQEYGIDVQFRPVAQPRFGGHIERLFGTIAKQLHTLPGTTFSSTREKGNYPSERRASLTLSELEQWLAMFLIDVYHRRYHSGIGTTPLSKYEEGMFGTTERPGCGLPPPLPNPLKLRIDFLPLVQRTVQAYGVQVDGLQYYHDVLRPWINAVDAKTGKKREFIFRRDPRDVSFIYFYDPELGSYKDIPYRDTSGPAMSVWELRAVRNKLKEQGVANIDENGIFSAFERMQQLAVVASQKTKSAKSVIKQSRARQGSMVATAASLAEREAKDPRKTDDGTIADEAIEPFDELEDA